MVEVTFNRELTEISDCVLAITGGRVDSKLEGTFYAYGETDDAALKRMIVRFVKTAVCQTIDPSCDDRCRDQSSEKRNPGSCNFQGIK